MSVRPTIERQCEELEQPHVLFRSDATGDVAVRAHDHRLREAGPRDDAHRDAWEAFGGCGGLGSELIGDEEAKRRVKHLQSPVTLRNPTLHSARSVHAPPVAVRYVELREVGREPTP